MIWARLYLAWDSLHSGASVKYQIALTALVAVALAGCETVPGGTAPFVSRDPVKYQSKTTHAVNWQELAGRAVAAMPNPGGEKPPVYVNIGSYVDGDAPFAVVYKQFLEEALLKANYPVVQSAATAGTVIDFDIHPLAYNLIPAGEDTNTEIVVSTRVADGGHLHFLHTETVYVRPEDMELYAPTPGLAVATLPVNGVSH